MHEQKNKFFHLLYWFVLLPSLQHPSKLKFYQLIFVFFFFIKTGKLSVYKPTLRLKYSSLWICVIQSHSSGAWQQDSTLGGGRYFTIFLAVITVAVGPQGKGVPLASTSSLFFFYL